MDLKELKTYEEDDNKKKMLYTLFQQDVRNYCDWYDGAFTTIDYMSFIKMKITVNLDTPFPKVVLRFLFKNKAKPTMCPCPYRKVNTFYLHFNELMLINPYNDY